MGRNALTPYDFMSASEIDAYRDYRRRHYSGQEQDDETRAGSRAYSRAKRQARPGEHAAYTRQRLVTARAAVVEVLGYACSACAVTGPPGFLDLDHIEGNGHEEKGRAVYKSGPPSTTLLAWAALKDGADLTAIYQWLCPNCHRLKTLEEKSCTQ